MKQNNSKELFGNSFDQIYNRNGPADPPDRKSGFSSDFMKSAFFGHLASDNDFWSSLPVLGPSKTLLNLIKINESTFL